MSSGILQDIWGSAKYRDEGGRATWSLACEGTEDRYRDHVAVSVDELSETASESDNISLAGDLWRILEGAREG
jgi:hypothetical protein